MIDRADDGKLLSFATIGMYSRADKRRGALLPKGKTPSDVATDTRAPGKVHPLVTSARLAVLFGLCVAIVGSVAAPSEAAVTLSEVANLINADAFYSRSYTGTRTLLANVEGGHVWTDHETLDDGQIAERIQFGVTELESFHPTSVTGVMVAGDSLNDGTLTATGPGIAPGATLWSGQIATSITDNSFTVSGNSLLWPLMIFGETGIEGETVDVINSSWAAGDDTGNTVFNVIYDYLANTRGVTMVVAAGNAGPGPATVGAPANSWNVITVGATDADEESEAVTSFSSGGKVSSFNLTETRTKPDIVAPGWSILVPTISDTTSFSYYSGTSFAAPVVAASAGLLIDLGKDTGRSTDPRVVKAVLLNSAAKLEDWQQETGVHPTTGTLINSTPVDSRQGTGRVDLAAAYEQYIASTGPGSGPGTVGTVGWDLDWVEEGAPRDYFINAILDGGTKLTATLIWFMDRRVSGFDTEAADPYAGTHFWNDSFDDLDLLLYRADAGGAPVGDPIAASISNWDSSSPDDDPLGLDSVEHLHFTLPEDGRYLLRVRWTQELFDYVADSPSEQYGLAWSSIPEPGTMALVCIGGLMILTRRRRRA